LSCENVWHAFGTTLCGTTVAATWAVMAILLILGLAAARGASVERPAGLQNIFEWFLGFVAYFIGIPDGERPNWRLQLLLEFLTTLVLFILVSNMFGLLPGLKSPTNTLNTNLALAALVFLLIQFLGFAEKGAGYLKRFTHPGGVLGAIMSPITLIEELAKPITLSMRLFGNIFAGELIIATLLQLLPLRWYYPFALIPHVGWLMFSIFVGCIQAFIFMVLSRAYVGQAMAAEEEHGHG
jgi:F-type H+-transporting ATPase subunit a